MPVIVAILEPTSETYTSLQKRVYRLAKEANIQAKYKHARTRDELKALLKTLVGERLCLCCDIADGDDETAEDVADYLTEIWQDRQSEWLAQRPLIIISDADYIVRDMKRMAQRHRREHSMIAHLLPSAGPNRWRDIHDALQAGILHA